MMRHDEPRANAAGQVDRLGGRHVAGNAACGVSAVDRQEQHVERIGTKLLGQARVMPVCRRYGRACSPSDSIDVPQVKMTPGRVGVEPLVGRGDRANAKAGTLERLSPASSPTIRSRGSPSASACSRIASGRTRPPASLPAARARSPGRSGRNACGWRARGRRSGRSSPSHRRSRHADVRPARGFVLLGQVLGEIEIDGQHARAAT